jgi:hypothetical protein
MVRQVLEGDGGAGVLGWVSLHLFVWPGMSRPLPWLQRRVTEKVVDERTALKWQSPENPQRTVSRGSGLGRALQRKTASIARATGGLHRLVQQQKEW